MGNVASGRLFSVGHSNLTLDDLIALLAGARRYAVAMLCGEEDPLICHRGLMIAPALVEAGVAPRHLRRGGRIETTAELEDRLLALTGLAERLEQPRLFEPPAERGVVL